MPKSFNSDSSKFANMPDFVKSKSFSDYREKKAERFQNVSSRYVEPRVQERKRIGITSKKRKDLGNIPRTPKNKYFDLVRQDRAKYLNYMRNRRIKRQNRVRIQKSLTYTERKYSKLIYGTNGLKIKIINRLESVKFVQYHPSLRNLLNLILKQERTREFDYEELYRHIIKKLKKLFG
jgi:hypothetical protein